MIWISLQAALIFLSGISRRANEAIQKFHIENYHVSNKLNVRKGLFLHLHMLGKEHLEDDYMQCVVSCIRYDRVYRETDRLTEMKADWLADWLTDRLTDWPTDRPTDRLAG